MVMEKAKISHIGKKQPDNDDPILSAENAVELLLEYASENKSDVVQFHNWLSKQNFASMSELRQVWEYIERQNVRRADFVAHGNAIADRLDRIEAKLPGQATVV